MNRNLILLMLVLIACQRHGGEPGENVVNARVPVTVASVETGEMADYLDLTATSVFQVKSVVKATVSGYVEEQLVNVGDVVSKPGELFRLRTKESAAIRHDSANSLGFSGLIKVKATLDGMVTSIDHPKGDYVQEGDQLAVISVQASLVYILEVPYEYGGYIRTGASCDLILPGGETVQGHIRSLLPSMNNAAQTRRYIIQPTTHRNDPENLIAQVRIVKMMNPKAISLPKTCILSDEVQQNFWVMKLINDSMAVKEIIKPGLQTHDRVEIAEPVFSTADRFLASGNYGLGDTAKVLVQGKR